MLLGDLAQDELQQVIATTAASPRRWLVLRHQKPEIGRDLQHQCGVELLGFLDLPVEVPIAQIDRWSLHPCQ